MFSVIIPAYNAEKVISKSVNSVLNQSYKSFEIIIVDDGSVDKTENIIKQFDDDRIRYIYQENGGVSAARNTGILASKGDYICFLDADDRWYTNHLESLASLIEKYSTCGMYITGYDILLINGKIVHKSQEFLKGIGQDDFTSNDGYGLLNRYGYFFNTNTICCHRTVFDKVGLFANGVKNGEDDDMWYRIFAYFSIAISKNTTTVYDRSNCGATKRRTNDSDVAFLSRVDGILESSEVPEYRKKSLLVWIEKNKLSQVRKLILNGKKKKARVLLKKVDYDKVNKKRHFITRLCLFIPTWVIKAYIDRRDAVYFGEKEK